MPEQAMIMNARHVIRTETASIHGALDKRIEKFDLARTEGLTVFLGMQWLALDALVRTDTQEWKNWSTALQDLRQAVMGDLAMINVDPGSLGTIAAPDRFGALGSAYVVAGSRLGARLLKRHIADLQKTGSLPQSWAIHYFTKQAMDHLWRDVLDAFDTLEGIEIAPVRQDALRVFGLFDSALNQMTSQTVSIRDT